MPAAVKVRKGLFIIFSKWKRDQLMAHWRNKAQCFILGSTTQLGPLTQLTFRVLLTTTLMGGT